MQRLNRATTNRRRLFRLLAPLGQTCLLLLFLKATVLSAAQPEEITLSQRQVGMTQMMKPKRKIPLTKKLALISLTLYQVLNGWQVSKAIGQTPNDHPTEEQSIILKWLGNAGWEIRYGKTIILIDPFLTRREAVLGAEWKPDEESVKGNF